MSPTTNVFIRVSWSADIPVGGSRASWPQLPRYRLYSLNYLLVFRIIAQRVPVFVRCKPWLVFVTKRNRAPQPLKSLFALAGQRICRSQPVSFVVICGSGLFYLIGQLCARGIALAQGN